MKLPFCFCIAFLTADNNFILYTLKERIIHEQMLNHVCIFFPSFYRTFHFFVALSDTFLSSNTQWLWNSFATTSRPKKTSVICCTTCFKNTKDLSSITGTLHPHFDFIYFSHNFLHKPIQKLIPGFRSAQLLALQHCTCHSGRT